MLTVEALHERWPVRHLCSYLFRNYEFRYYLSYETDIFFQNTLNLMYISEMQKKIEKKFRVLEISAFELVAVNSRDSKQNACNRQSKC